jgi:hypothetical protein
MGQFSGLGPPPSGVFFLGVPQSVSTVDTSHSIRPIRFAVELLM